MPPPVRPLGPTCVTRTRPLREDEAGFFVGFRQAAGVLPQGEGSRLSLAEWTRTRAARAGFRLTQGDLSAKAGRREEGRSCALRSGAPVLETAMTSADPAVVSPSSADEEALLAWILGDLAPPDPGGKVARRLIARFHGLAGLVAADAAVLRAEGLDGACVVALEQARALAEALVRIRACERPVVSSWSALTDYLRAALAHAPREQFRVLYLDKRNILMRDELRADGTVDHAPVYAREVVRRALELSASALILAHNHPSGDPTPSRADIEMTRKIVEAARVFDIAVHDHVVVGREGTKSFRALGLM